MSYDLQNFYKSTLLLDWSIGTGNFYVTAKPTVSTGWLVISPNNTSLREIVKFTATGTDANGDYVTVSVRGVGGTTEQTHTQGEPIRMNITAEYWDDMNQEIADIVAAGAVNANTTTKGLVEIATQAEVNSGTAIGGTGASLAVTPATLGITGLISPYAGSSAPTGWLLCDGTAVSRTTYATLFGVTSTTYGTGDGSTTFNLPDLRNRTPIGAGTGTKVATFASRSSNVITVTGLTNAANNEFQTGQAVLYSAPSGAMTGLTDNTTYYLIRTGNLTFSLATTLANAIDNVPISLSSDGTGTQTFTLTFTTRAVGGTGGEENHALTTAELAAHTHTLDSIYKQVGGFGGFNGGNSGPVNVPNTGSAGGDTSHNNMQPFLNINYIIKY